MCFFFNSDSTAFPHSRKLGKKLPLYKFGKFLKKPEYLRQEMRRTYAEFQKNASSLMQVLDYIIRFNMSFQVNNMFILKNAENLCAVPKGGIVLYAGIRLHNKIQHLFSGNNMFILKNM